MLKPLKHLLVLLSIVLAQPALAANGCSPYSNYGGNNGKTWFNEYYFGPAASDFLEIFSKNSTVNQSNQSIWNNWHLRVYSRAGNSIATETYRLNTNTTACTVSGGRTYLTYSDPALSLNYNDAMVVVFDGPPDLASTREIDALVYSNTLPPTPYTNSFKFYTPTCPALKSALDTQLAATAGKSSYNGQNMLILNSFGTKDIARLPDGTGAWDETTLTGSGTTYTQCVTNDPVDLVKSFTWAPTYTVATSSGTVDPGAVVTFTIAATNKTSASMVGVKVSDTLPTGLTYAGGLTVSAGATASCSGTPTTCVMTASSALAVNAKISMSFQATVSSAAGDAGATFQNTAIQSGGTTLDPAPSADAYVTVASGLALTMGADKSTPAAGERLTFTVTATNSTSYPMAGTVVTVPFPTGLDYYSGYVPQVTGGTVSCTASGCTWTLPATLAAGAGATLTFQATASGTAGQAITTTATQTSGSALVTKPAASLTITMAGASAATFNACHNFAASNCSRTAGRLYTRLVGTSFTTEIVALKADDSVATDYVGAGGAARTVKVELLNADNANSQIATQNVTFAGGDTTGRVTATWPALTTAYKNIRVRITETTGTQPISELSSDTFAVRPSAVVVTTSANADTAVNNSTPVVKAGRPFTITASTSPSAAYAGTVTVDATRLSTGNLQVGNLRDASGSSVFSVQVNATPADNATYDEVGYFYAAEGAFRDESFTLVDQPDDCLTSATGNAYIANALDSATGKYGCHIGNTAPVSFARFIPDHFAVVPTPALTPGHATCGFTYMDQPFALTAQVEARNAAGTRTRNYNGTFANGVVAVQMENANDGVPIPVARLNRPGTQGWSEGTFSFSANRFNRQAAPDGPFDQLAIGLSVTDETALPAGERPLLRERDMDNTTTTCTADTAGASNGTCTAVNLINTPTRNTRVRFGRLRLWNAHGSELLPLTIPVRAEFFSPNLGFITNTVDSCTTLVAGNIQLGNHVPAGFATSMKASNIQIGAFTNGVSDLRLSTPNPRPAAISRALLCVDLGADTASTTAGVTAPACTATTSADMPWLQGRWSEALYDDDPSSLATFGVYKAGPVIHVREVFW